MTISDNPQVSIVIPTINQAKLVKRCIRSILDTLEGSISYEIIVIDDGSPAFIQTALKEKLTGFPLRLINNCINTGFSRVVNKGVAYSRGRYICLVNNDVLFTQKQWLNILLKEALRTQAGVVGGRLLYPDHRIQHGGIYYQPAQRRFDHEFRYESENHPPALATRGVLGVTGALMLINRKLWDLLGGMDERFFLSWEDVDFSLRAWQAGWSVVYTGKAYAIHPEGSTRGNRGQDLVSVWEKKEQETKKFFWKKWQGKVSLLTGIKDANCDSISQTQAAQWRRIIHGAN